ncbi:hypothetical protein ERICII_02704 [Paenibacillus larvae subsp. larvae DSM 25430]|uniref:Uncharacterized protein n=1 Tax=Paenibacillus larvae subsp. larvae DSM 25430 TaxID=697284 RepID=V9W8L9_9BACL|nr:hypothetical protein ERIC2_c27160 [Paenibacillus larvae subsp. larvae DSM 25430]AVG13058.1 hypothetical protein ERICII_02704 [Paenibacillus larvae subsp. larvae DSM 25430]
MNITLDLTSQLKEQLDKDIQEIVIKAVDGLVSEDRVMTKKKQQRFFKSLYLHWKL